MLGRELTDAEMKRTLGSNAKHLREKDIADFQRVLPAMDQTRRSRLIGWLNQIHLATQWIGTPAIHKS
jgi:hypothetical protein